MVSELKQGNFRIGVIGRFRIGKSTFLNVFLGGRVLREEEAGGGCTAMVTRIVRGDEFSAKLIYHTAEEMHDVLLSVFLKAEITPDIHDARVKNISDRAFLFHKGFRLKNIVLLNKRKQALTEEVSRRKALIDFALHILTRWEEFEHDLGTHKVVSREDYNTLSGDRSLAPFIKEARLTVPFTGLPDNVVLIDTPGLGAPNWDENITVKYLEDCHAAIHLLLPPAGFEAIDADLLTYLKRKQPHIFDKVIFCINRSDEVSTHTREEIRAHVTGELDKHGFSDLPVLFLCSKFPFLSRLKAIGENLSPAEQEYLEFASFKFKLLDSELPPWENILSVSGFDELKSSLNKLLVTGRARAILQKGLTDLQGVGREVKNHFQSQAALVERGQGGNFKLIAQIDECLDMVQYERRRAEREIQREIGNLQVRLQKWIAPFREPPDKQKSGVFKDIALFLKHTKEELDRIKAKEKAHKRGEIVPEDGQFEFFGTPVIIRGFRDEIDLAAFRIFRFIDNFWSVENFNNIKSGIPGAKPGENMSDQALAEMRDLFLSQLSEQCHQLLIGPIDGVHQDIESVYQKACDNMQLRISGLTEELVARLNNILDITFQPVKVETVDQSLNKILGTFDRLKNLGRARGIWENMVDWFSQNTKLVHENATKVDQKRINRIRNDLKKYLSEYLFFPIVQDISSYILEVLANLKNVLSKELDQRMEEIRSHAIVEKFGATRKQIKTNIQEALKRQPEIERIEARLGQKLEEGICDLEKDLGLNLYPRDN
jgi:GTP-binding protein EngB required for normal cell division